MGLKVKGGVHPRPQAKAAGLSTAPNGACRSCPVHADRAGGTAPGEAGNPLRDKEKKIMEVVFSAWIYSLGPRVLEQLCFLLI